MTCECGKDAPFEECCGKLLDGSATAKTCEELVRSRFVAFGLGNFDYIEATQTEPLSDEVRNREAPEWERLEIVACEDGGEDDETGTVEFVAYYRLNGKRMHHEKSSFVRENGEWRYSEGQIEDSPVKSSSSRDKVGRNHPCPCGSGRKYKRCCGV